MNTLNIVKITLGESTLREFAKRTAEQPLDPQAVAAGLFEQFVRHAPPEVVAFLAYQGGAGGDLWAHLATQARAKARQEFSADLELAQAVRKVMAVKGTT